MFILYLNFIDSISPARQKYDNRVASYKTDKKLLDAELERAVGRLRKSDDKAELFETEEDDHMVSFLYQKNIFLI